MTREIRARTHRDAPNAPNAVQEPLSPFKFTFTRLSREIRDQIYTWALSSPSPIIVWKGRWGSHDDLTNSYTTFTDVVEWNALENHYRMICKRWVDASATKTSLRDCSTNLFYCNKEIGKEAAQAFYRKNVFAFLGDHNWDPIVSWLSKIHNRNRNHLSRLEISAYRPEEVWQRPSGERMDGGDRNKEPIYPRSPYLQLRTPLQYGLVENINPAVEIIFQLLGQKTSTHKLTLDFKLSGDYPGQGIFLQEDDHYPQHRWCSMDLPNLVEKFRTLYTILPGASDSSEPSIEVIWTGKCPRVIAEREDRSSSRTTIQDHLENIKDRGWEIELSPMEGEDWEWGPHGSPYDKNRSEETHIPTFVLRRKPLEEPLIGDDPNPYSGSGVPLNPEDEGYELEQTNPYYS